MLFHCLDFCSRITDTGRHNYYILLRRLCYVRVASVPRISVGLGPHKKKRKCGAAREARRGKQVAHRLLLLAL